ncbi:MAG: hypothetical protein IKC07_03650 [Clostridia bacterium]|nr:hypothetical protein [Clostridia bacterium]
MKFLKRFNLLDYIIFAGIIITVLFALYSFLPERSRSYKMVISYEGEADIKNGDVCFDMDGNKTLGKIKLSGENFSVSFGGRDAENGIKMGERTYALNLPLKMIVGDYYLEGKVEEIYRDFEED